MEDSWYGGARCMQCDESVDLEGDQRECLVFCSRECLDKWVAAQQSVQRILLESEQIFDADGEVVGTRSVPFKN